jgi:hypothetical protein
MKLLTACLTGVAVVGATLLGALVDVGAPPPVHRESPGGADSLGRLIDGFERLEGWTATASDGVDVKISEGPGARGSGLKIDFDFHGGAGYVIARKVVDLDLPPDYAFTFAIRGDAPRNNLEFKLVDSTGDNVWWRNQRSFEFPDDWKRVSIRSREIEFAWGPKGGGKPTHIAAIEFAISAGTGGNGTVQVDNLVLDHRDPEPASPPPPRATASPSSGTASLAVDGDSATSWDAPGDSARLMLDLGMLREHGGLVIDWRPARHAVRYSLESSNDGASWDEVFRAEHGNGGRDYVPVEGGEARHLRLRLREPASQDGYAIREIAVKPVEWSATRNDLVKSIAAESPRGAYPRYWLGEQAYWTVVGTSGHPSEVLLNEDGLLEVPRGQLAIEPFLVANDELVTWADVRTGASLAERDLPIPTVTWTTPGLSLGVTVVATGDAVRAVAVARYRVRNLDDRARRVRLVLALRPFQVNPPWQFLGVPGGAVAVRDLAVDSGGASVNGARRVLALTRPSALGAASADEGDISEFLRGGKLPPRVSVRGDRLGLASGALVYDLEIDPRASNDVELAIPLDSTAHAVSFETAYEEARVTWRASLDRVVVRLPRVAASITATLRTTLAYILINRDGPAIQPGSRSYERSWIRDGALTSAAMLRLGHTSEVRDFLTWFARYQFPSGKVPCCVDHRGADPVPEHDSHGELIYLVAEYYRHTGDRAVAQSLWPRVLDAARYIDSLRHTRLTSEYDAPAQRHFRGLLPPSISHEGYSAKPMHSYWDDFFALRGLKDAAFLANVFGTTRERQELARWRDEFRRDVVASINAAMRVHEIDFIPGAADLGDFDATSTTIALAPVGEETSLPRQALERTFERYWDEAVARRDGRRSWDSYTPYELRAVGTFIRLGWPARAHELLDFFMAHRRPGPWNQWGEVVWRESRAPRFVGDIPHTWVGSDFIRSALDFFAYERERDSSLVIGAGIPLAWVVDNGGVVVRGLRTHYGPLTFTATGGAREVAIDIAAGTRIPPGGIAIRAPFDMRPATVVLNGAAASPGQSGEVVVRQLPARVRFGS